MDELIICPKCTNPGLEVYYETVKSLVNVENIAKDDWFLCTNPNCNVAYFSKENVIYKDQIILICYCAEITLSEIKESINICKYKNPTGRCCSNLFSYFIKKFSHTEERCCRRDLKS